jgi:hypothetical protein
MGVVSEEVSAVGLEEVGLEEVSVVVCKLERPGMPLT